MAYAAPSRIEPSDGVKANEAIGRVIRAEETLFRWTNVNDSNLLISLDLIGLCYNRAKKQSDCVKTGRLWKKSQVLTREIN